MHQLLSHTKKHFCFKVLRNKTEHILLYFCLKVNLFSTQIKKGRASSLVVILLTCNVLQVEDLLLARATPYLFERLPTRSLKKLLPLALFASFFGSTTMKLLGHQLSFVPCRLLARSRVMAVYLYGMEWRGGGVFLPAFSSGT